jgi:hypothetical protein
LREKIRIYFSPAVHSVPEIFLVTDSLKTRIGNPLTELNLIRKGKERKGKERKGKERK